MGLYLSPSASHMETLSMPPLPFGPCGGGHLGVPAPRATQTPAPPALPHLPHQPPRPLGPVPDATETPWVTLLLRALPASAHPPAPCLLPPHRPAVPRSPGWGSTPLPAISPQHPLPPSQRDQGRSRRHPRRPHAVPQAPSGRLRWVPPLPGRGTGGPRWVLMAHASAGDPTLGVDGPCRCW